ncbi:pentatricopeptide repeat-containing protein At1g71460, chloroplastic-like [Pistacia vera]|uniref:pentatricopeptide repeat-containing protein At1g71460, chloroplastic-like n=1 Tax=Pistacia vera TaxID=55513 RepID=UPI00126304B7|nr:pentatricopeptide repeat-containing protein At1g71460, chloroplastic-like [Pistacia vera]
MESSTLALPLSLCIHISSPNPLNTKLKFFRLNASTNSQSFHLHPRSKHRAKRPSKKPKPFAKEDAFPSSLPLHSKNPYAIYKDIQGFAKQNKLKEALAILDYVDQEGIPVNPTTFSALLAACVRRKALDYGKQVHVYIRINGLENNEFLRTKLVHMYTSCGSFEDADKVFEESSSRSVYPWNALLRGTVIAGKKRYRDVLVNYMKMRELGVDLNVYTFSCVIKSFAGASAFTQGLKTHALLIKNGFVDYSILRTSLVDMYFKCGKIKLAKRVFEEIDDRDIVMWGAMISGFAHNRLQREALDYVREMISEGIYPNSVVLTILLPVIGEVCARKLGREVHGYVLKRNKFLEHPFIQSGLVDMYCKCGDMNSGRRAFYAAVDRNAVVWTALMSGYISNGRLEQALRSIVWMQQEGFRPDVVTVATVLPVCAQLRALKQGKEIHAYTVKSWFLPNVSITTSLMIMYSKCGVLEYSLKLFDSMDGRNVISWTAIIDSCIENGRPYEALTVFRSMQSSKHRPDSVAMSRMLSVCGQLKALKLGKEIHGQVLKKDFESIPFVAAENINMYGMCGFINSAKSVFDSVPVKGVMTWTAIIQACGYNDLSREALSLFNKMRYGGFTPNHITFKVLLSICNQAGLAAEACQIFHIMFRKYNIKASEEHYSIMVELLNRFGRVEDARKFREMSSLLS